ncbi:hypothetical protein GALMADRAFT_225258 [Galerina marginata CBS 339.88]|uniref:Retrotransposon Copia-like N-terminal domain-containing protein n=1 Tax=Galerina marginata (strain CBS 339.88) TaxID=685588 RepID=A0A067T1W2_GALM3|nr:hypothetical protein GALMADRAFT_225258 [Galerina marginata CBS 339.88]
MSTIKLDHVVLLVGSDNFELWKRGIRQVLQGLGFWGHVGGNVNQFSPFPITPQPATCNLQSTATELSAFRQWWKDDSQARTIVERRISPIILNLLPQGDTVTAREVWMTLQATYGRVDVMAQFALRDRVNSLKLVNHEDLDRYIGEFKTARLRFIEMGIPFTEYEMVHAILSGLPLSSHWPHFHQLMTQTVQDHLDKQTTALVPAAPDALLDRIIARLVIECQRLEIASLGKSSDLVGKSNDDPIVPSSVLDTSQTRLAATTFSSPSAYEGDLSC